MQNEILSQNLTDSAITARSAGERGADVDTLRGTNGADFEGFATISRGEGGGGCCSGGDDNSEKLLLIKGPFVFVFKNEEDKSPKYAVSLTHMKASNKGNSQRSYLVTLGSNLGDVEYVINFKDEKIAKFFVDAATEQAKVGETEEVRKVSISFIMHRVAFFCWADHSNCFSM
jgi:hypothetical protein